MAKDIRRQYDDVAETFSKNHVIGWNSNDMNRRHFYSIVRSFFPNRRAISGKRVLDIACGDGYDAARYLRRGFSVFGVDASRSMLEIARERYPAINFKLGMAERLPYGDGSFDAVFSKYAIMTSRDLRPIFREAHRVLKKGGIFIYLVTHPFRQHFEKKSARADYFKQKLVTSNILNGSVSLREPTHTLGEYLSPDFLERFDVLRFEERFEPAAERIGKGVYPGYFVLACRKR